MDIAETKYTEIETLKSWFPDKESSYFWGGPGLRFPFSHISFLEDILWEKMPSYSMHDEAGELVGFGQYYEKIGRCHLARLVISPKIRGKGHGQWFISQLINVGTKHLNCRESSLFVVRYNQKALRCYEMLGFKKQDYPPGHKYYVDIDYMVSSSA
jgi:ribosomal protein S18 acetylase RimI-like enzyme